MTHIFNVIIGKWVTDHEDKESINQFGNVSLVFSTNGILKYIIHEDEKDQIIFLTYRIEGDFLITDQPSTPKEERTRFEITADGHLVLYYEKDKSIFIKAID